MMLFKLFPFLSLLVTAQAALTYKGVDWSSTLVEEAAGKTWKSSGGTTTALETLIKNSGANTVRQRVWVNPSNGNYNLDYNLKLGARAHAAGLNIYLDLHLSDTWADPGHQAAPSGWPTNIDDLCETVYTYTMSVCNAFHSAGIPISIVSIGNEVTNGVLWPLGESSSFYNIARILHSAAWGVKDSGLSPTPQIMIHLDNGWNWATQQWWYTSALAAGPLLASDFDIMGLSYYPFYSASATLASLRQSLTNMAATWHKALVVAETDWPTACPSPADPFPSDAASIPFSAAGQTTWVKDVAAIVAATSGGKGLFYWEPAWLDNANLGSSCANNLMFSSSGVALSSLAVFGSI